VNLCKGEHRDLEGRRGGKHWESPWVGGSPRGVPGMASVVGATERGWVW
jgi:hypothetical protein